MNSSLKQSISRRFDTAWELSRALFAAPEISGEEFKSSALFAKTLADAGFVIEAPFCEMPTAFKATFGNGAGPRVALLAEYDALPVVGHGCGHNLHGALSILAALALSDERGDFRGTLCVIGTPSEEAAGAKIEMAAKGVFDDYDLALMAHSYSGGVSQSNMDALSLRSYTLTFKGQNAHAAAAPWQGHSALAAARKFLDLVDARRECFTPDVKFNAIIKKGGDAVNIIPDFAELYVEFRTDSMGKLKTIDEIAKKCARGTAIALDCEENWRSNYDDFADMVRIPALETEMERIFASLGIKTTPVTPPLGSTDVGNVSYRCPALQPLLSICEEPFALHTHDFAAATQKPEAQTALSLGAEALSLLALKVFNDDSYRKLVLAGFAEAREKKLG